MNENLPLVVANLKANLNWDQTSAWIDEIGPKAPGFKGTIIFCPSTPFLAAAAQKISQNLYEIKLGSQDVSAHDVGAYTGEFAASQIADFVRYSIVGHSERRKYFAEKDEDVIQKVKQLLKAEITPILCISDLSQLDTYLKEEPKIKENLDKIIFVYEPPEAISGGGEYQPEDPKLASENASKIIQKLGQSAIVIYGGSINPQDAHDFFSQENLSGGLIGQASVDPETFSQILDSLK